MPTSTTSDNATFEAIRRFRRRRPRVVALAVLLLIGGAFGTAQNLLVVGARLVEGDVATDDARLEVSAPVRDEDGCAVDVTSFADAPAFVVRTPRPHTLVFVMAPEGATRPVHGQSDAHGLALIPFELAAADRASGVVFDAHVVGGSCSVTVPAQR